VMIELKDPHSQLQMLNVILLSIERGDSPNLVAAGLPPNLLDDLRELKHVDLTRLVSKPLGFTLALEPSVLSHQIRVLNEQLDQQRLREYFALHAAPVSLMQQLFRMSREEVFALRHALKVAPDSASSSPLSRSVREQIESAWLKARIDFGKAQSLADKARLWLKLHKAMPLPISMATIYNVVMSFESLGGEKCKEVTL